MAFGLDFAGASVSEMNSFYSGHHWPATGLDMNNNDDYAQDPSRGEWLDLILKHFQGEVKFH